MRKFIKRLGKKVQDLLKKIFSSVEETDSAFGLLESDIDWDKISAAAKEASASLEEMTEAFGQIYINGEPFEGLQSIVSLSIDGVSDEEIEEIKRLLEDEDGDSNLGTLKFDSNTKIQENFFNIPLTFLPKRYWCKTLLISLAAEQENEYQAVDLSQYEERKLVHYISGRTQTWEEIFKDMSEDEDEYAWLLTQLDSVKEHGIFSSFQMDREIFYYEDLGLWSLEEL